MSYNVIHKPKVHWDITDALAYYKAISPKLAGQFLSRFKEAVAHIENHPKGFQIKYGKVRTLMLTQFPYVIHYFIDDTNKQIAILALVHSHRDQTDYSKK